MIKKAFVINHFLTSQISRLKSISYEQYINYLIIGYAFVLSTTIAGIVFFEHMLILSFLFHRDFRNIFSELKKSKVIIVLFLFVSLSLLSVIWSSDKIYALLYIKKYWHFLAIPVIYLSLSAKYKSHIIGSFLLGMLVSELLSFGIFFELIHFQDINSNDPSPFMNHSDYSLYLSFAAVLSLNKIFYTEKFKYKLIYALYFLFTTSTIFINGGRTGQVIFVVTVFITFFLNYKNKIKAVTVATILCLATLTTAYYISPVFKERGVQGYNDVTSALTTDAYNDSFGIRLYLWRVGLNIFKKNPLIGTGIGDEKEGFQYHLKEYEDFSKYTNILNEEHVDFHSMYIQHAVHLGLTGFILMLLLIYSIFMIKFKSLLYRNINITFATSILIYSLVGNVLHAIFPLAYFVFFVSTLSAISRVENKT